MEGRQINDLFDARPEAAFGCVFFDREDDGTGRAEPRYGKGWMSIEGQKAERFSDPRQLDQDVRWLTNLDKKSFWLAGAVGNRSLRHSGYLRVELGQLMKEAGLLVKELDPAGVCERLSEIYARLSRLARAHYGILEFRESELREQLARALAVDDQPVSMEVDEALRRSWQEVVSLTLPGQEPKRAMIFRRPRLAHAKALLETPIPVGGWEFLDARALPPEGARLDWLFAKNRPFLAKVKVGEAFATPQSRRVASLLSFSDPMASGSRRRERDWMCSNELFYWAQHARIEPLAVFMAEDAKPLAATPGILELGPLSEHSLSLGLLAEAHWMALAGRSRHPAARSAALVSPRAAFLRAADRFLCFCSALEMQTRGFEPVSYGMGAVSVAFDGAAQVKALGQALQESGLLAPAGLFEALRLKVEGAPAGARLGDGAREQLEGRLESARDREER
jgi:hypothetical protein